MEFLRLPNGPTSCSAWGKNLEAMRSGFTGAPTPTAVVVAPPLPATEEAASARSLIMNELRPAAAIDFRSVSEMVAPSTTRTKAVFEHSTSTAS